MIWPVSSSRCSTVGFPTGAAMRPGIDCFPRAYLDPTEDEAETEWQGAVHEDLVRQKSAAVGALVDSLDEGAPGPKGTLELTLAQESVEQWVSALNDVRLALGVVLEVSEDEVRLEPDDPRAPGLELYGWLTWLQGSLVDELLRGHRTTRTGREAMSGVAGSRNRSRDRCGRRTATGSATRRRTARRCRGPSSAG